MKWLWITRIWIVDWKLITKWLLYNDMGNGDHLITYLPILQPTRPPTYLHTYRTTNPPIYLLIYPPTYLTSYLLTHLPNYLFLNYNPTTCPVSRPHNLILIIRNKKKQQLDIFWFYTPLIKTWFIIVKMKGSTPITCNLCALQLKGLR